MKKKPELRQLRQLRITEAIFLKKNLNYVNYVITPITQLQKRQNHPLVLPLVQCMTYKLGHIEKQKSEITFSSISFKISCKRRDYFTSLLHVHANICCRGPNVQCPRAKLDKLIGFDRTNEASFR